MKKNDQDEVEDVGTGTYIDINILSKQIFGEDVSPPCMNINVLKLRGRARIIVQMAEAMKYVSSHNSIISNHNPGEIYKSSYYNCIRASILNMIILNF